MRVLLAGFALAVLAGCSSLPRDSGYEVRTVEATGRQEPWQNMSINFGPFKPEGVTVVYVKLPQPLPQHWKEEFVDNARTYEVRVGQRRLRKPVVREVFRAVVVGSSGKVQTYDAVVDEQLRGLSVYVPVDKVEVVRGQSLLILSSDGKWGMTIRGEKVEFKKGFAPDQLPAEFFRNHPSTVMQVIRLNPNTDEFARAMLDDLVRRFPKPFSVDGRPDEYLGKTDVSIVFSEFTSLEGIPDQLISCTSLKLVPGSTALLPITSVLYGYQAVRALSMEDCKK